MCLKNLLTLRTHSEEYHQEILKGYLVYRKAYLKQLLASAFSHPGSFCGVMTDFIKRKL